MSLLNKIKSVFRKDLQSVLAPLENIHNKLGNFLDQVAMDIADNVKKISLIQIENDAKKVEQETAAKVKENLKTLLGKL